jgi:hypothetical protein
MEFEKGWLLRQIQAAAKEVDSWSDAKKAAYKIIPEEPMSDREYQMRYDDARKYGNY